MAVIKFKRGASFVFTGPILVNNVVQNMTGWLIRSALRERTNDGTVEGGVGFEIATLPAIWLDLPSAIAQIGNTSVATMGWPLGTAVIDVELTAPGGTIILTNTQQLLIVDRITR